MTTDSPSPPDHPVPPPQLRKTIGGPAAEPHEGPLWDLDHPELEDTDGPPPPMIAPAPIRPKAFTTEVTPRNPVEPGPILPTPIRLPGAQTSVMRRVSKADFLRASQPPRHPLNPTPQSPTTMESDFDDLEDWAIDEPAGAPAPAPQAAPQPAPETGPPSAPEAPQPRPDPSRLADLSDLSDLPSAGEPRAAAGPADASDPAPAPQPERPSRTPSPAPDDPGDEFSFKPSAKAVAHRSKPHLRLSVLEKIGLAVLLAVLLAGGVWGYRNAFGSIAMEQSAGGTKLPARGEFLTITRIESYWRPPITSGDHRESVKLDVTLIPVVEVTLSGQGTIRALFSNDTGTNVGDPVDRQIQGETTITIPCTDGFKELADHRAYQVDLIKAWHIRLLEAPAATTTGQAFKPVANAPISTQLK